jgi:hypothetical protein
LNETHVSREQLRSFLLSEGPRQEAMEVVLHLLTGCTVCQKLAARLVAEMDARDEAYVTHFCLLIEDERKAIQERRDAKEQWLQLQPLNKDQRKNVIRNRESFQTWGLFSRLNSCARIIVRDDPEQALEVAELSLFVAMHLEPEKYGKALIADAKLQAFIEIANAERVLEDFGSATDHLDAAATWLAEGTDDPMVKARLESVSASILIDVGSFEHAVQVLGEVAFINRQINDWHEFAKTKILQAAAYRHFDPVEGYKAARLGLRSLDASDRFTYLCGIRNLIDCVNEAGEHGEALLLYQRHKREFETYDSHKMQFGICWLEARINKGIALLTGQRSYMESAASALLALELDYAEAGQWQEMALVQLDLVELYALTGKLSQSIATAVRAYEILKANNLHADTQQVWIYLQQAMREYVLTEGIVAQARRVLSRYWKTGVPEAERLA